MYKLAINGVRDLNTNGFIVENPDSFSWKRYQAWLAAGNTPEPADPPPPPSPDWKEFLKALRSTTAFSSIRTGARSNVALTALAAELRTNLGEAALGLAEPQVIQGLLDELLPSLTEPQRTEIRNKVTEFNIPLTL